MAATATHDEVLRRRALGAPSARSLLFTVLGEFVLPRDGRVWSETIVDALGVLGVEEKSARQALARTAADGWLQRQRAGRRVQWRLSEAATALLREGAERIYTFGGSHEDWDGRWLVVVIGAADLPRDMRHRLRTGLAWAGFGALRAGVWIAAHVEREREAEHVLEGLGLRDEAYMFRADIAWMDRSADLIRRAWDLDDLEHRYEAFIEEFGPLRPKGAETSFVALTRLVHTWRKFPFLDPALPARLLPSGWSGDRAHDLFHAKHASLAIRANEWFAAHATIDDERNQPSRGGRS